jgi:hypothetical protein
MKPIIFALALFLSGCAQIQTVLKIDVASYSETEYVRATELRTAITLATNQCKDHTAMKAALDNLNTKALELTYYSQGLPKNNQISLMESQLNNVISEMIKHYDAVDTTSQFYCIDKIDTMSRAASTIQHAIGNKPK